MSISTQLIIRHMGLQPYEPVWHSMKAFTKNRQPEDHDELWILQHSPVFTQGQAGKPEHILNAQQIPVVQTDRGGQVTYHGPGQLVVYPLINVQRQHCHIRELVSRLENTVIQLLQEFSIQAAAKKEAPGVYVDHKKICSIGLRLSRGYSYHGIALNVDMDLTPFTYINPCGYTGLTMTQISEFCPTVQFEPVASCFVTAFLRHFRYTAIHELRSHEKSAGR